MTTLRQAAQQALEALKWSTEYRTGCAAHVEAYEDLRAALAEPCPCGDRPAAQCPGEWEPGCDLGNNPKYAKRVEMTPKELAARIKRGEKWKVAEPVQEPVGVLRTLVQIHPDGTETWREEPVWIAPPQRKPLTEEEIVEAVREADLDWQAGWTLDEHEPNRFTTLARAIERAHGIT